jgi:hypothetical protein
MTITDIRPLEKHGGKSGTYITEKWALTFSQLLVAPVGGNNQVQSQPKVFANLRPVGPALEVKQGPARSIGQNQHAFTQQTRESIQHCLKRDHQKIHKSLCLVEPKAGLNHLL